MEEYTLKHDTNYISINYNGTSLNLDKTTGQGRLSNEEKVQNKAPSMNIKGVLGLLKLKKHSYLIVITKAKDVGQILGHNVYLIEKTNIIIFETIDAKEDDKYDLKALNEFLKVNGLYYSDYPLYKSYGSTDNDNFVFNKNLISNFEAIVKDNTSQLVKKIIQGYFNIVKKDFEYALISRRSWKRSGMRLFSRGSDNHGFVSNYVETEQLVIDKDNVVSFLQARGSIPLKWRHKIAIRLNPPIIIDKTDVIVKANKNFEKRYGDVFYLNLIQHKNYENVLNSVFKQELKKYKYESLSFDFKNENMEHCVETRNAFVAGLIKFLDKHAMSSSDGSTQKGLIRTNCIDCLDRTNVVQFFIAKEALKKQTQELGKDYASISEYVSKFWYENGNSISVQYSGTPSLKSTLILGGNHTFFGKLRDGFYSAKRYVLNRFYDGKLHDGYQLFTGNYKKMIVRRRMRINIKMYITTLFTIFMVLYLAGNDFKGRFKNDNVTIGLVVGFVSFYVVFFDKFLLFPRYCDE